MPENKKEYEWVDQSSNQYILKHGYFIHRFNARLECPEHTHDYVEIVYNFNGKSLHYVDGKPYLLGRGDLLFINFGSSHSVYPQPTAEYADIMLKPEFIDERLKGTKNAFVLLELNEFKDFSDTVERDRRFIHFSGDDRRQIEYLIDLTVSEQNKTLGGKDNMKRSALSLLLNLVFKNMNKASERKVAIDEELIEYVRDHCHEHLTVFEMAKKCFYSEEHFSRSFKKYTGKNFTEYINDCRIERAKTLLRYTEKSVEDVFGDCGFNNRTNFFKSFSNKTGYTPLQYRKIYKK